MGAEHHYRATQSADLPSDTPKNEPWDRVTRRTSPRRRVVATDQARRAEPGAEITGLHVIDPTEPGYSYYPFDSVEERQEEPPHGSEEWYERAKAFADELYDAAAETVAEYDVTFTTELVIGAPAEAIVEYARDHDIDHVILGSHGRGEDAAIALGSVTEAVAFRSPVRVTLIR